MLNFIFMQIKAIWDFVATVEITWNNMKAIFDNEFPLLVLNTPFSTTRTEQPLANGNCRLAS